MSKPLYTRGAAANDTDSPPALTRAADKTVEPVESVEQARPLQPLQPLQACFGERELTRAHQTKAPHLTMQTKATATCISIPKQPTTLVLDEVLDAASCNAMRRFQKVAQCQARGDAAIDLRRTRAIRSNAWGTLVKAVRDLKHNGHEVTVIASKRLLGLLQISELMRHARIVIAAEL